MGPLSIAGIFIFCIVLLSDVFAIFLDFALMSEGLPTISRRVWERPVLGLPIMLWQVVGGIGLGIHFYLYWR